MSRPGDHRAAPTHGTITNTVTISGGTVAGSVIGAGKVTTGHVGGAARPPTVADLRARVTALRDEIVAAGATVETRDKLAYELREMLDALSEEKPDPAPVKTRWSAVQKLLAEVTAAGTAVVTAIKEVTDLITVVFGGN